MKTPTDFLLKTGALLCLVTLFSNCNKNPFGDGMGAVSFYVCESASNCGGSVTAEIEGQRHTMTSYFVYCPTPGEDDETSEGLFRVVLPVGSYDYTITAKSGGSYSGSVNISEGDLTPVQISGSSLGCSGGGGGGGSVPPSNYDVQGTVYVRSTTVQFSFYDGSTIDNDRIQVVFNGNTEAADLLISGSKQTMTITNMPADSWLGIIAVSEGDIPPCTPDVDVYDGYSTQTFVIRSYINEPGAYIIKLN